MTEHRLTHFEEHNLALHAIGFGLEDYYRLLSLTFRDKSWISMVNVVNNLPDWVFHANPNQQLLAWASQEYQALANWYHHGKIVYRVSKELTQMLLSTEIRIPYELFKLPFPGFYVEFEGLDTKIHNQDGTSHPYLGSYVWDGQIEENNVRYAKDHEPGQPAVFMFHVSRHHSKNPHMIRTSRGMVRAPETSNTIRSWYRYQDLEERGFSSDVFEELLREAMENRQRVFMEEEFAKEWVRIERLIAAFIVYLTMPDVVLEKRDPGPDFTKLLRSLQKTKNPGKRRKLQKRLGRSSTQKYIYLPYVPSRGQGEAPEGTRRLDHRVAVTGHFKSQAHGKGRKLRKTIWIRPYWKGPEGAELGSSKRRVR